MTHDDDLRRTPGSPPDPIDDAVMAKLVRDVAEDWQMPPQRLNAPTWRDRVDAGGRRAGGRRAGGGWLGRLGAAGAFAVGLTVVLSLVAVWITMPSGRTGLTGTSPSAAGSPQVVGSATPRLTPRTAASPLPKLSVAGDLPDPTSVLVRVGGGYAIADLGTGTLGARLEESAGIDETRRLADGTYVCLCIATDSVVRGAYTHAVVQFRTYDAGGNATGSAPIGEYTGVPDPRPPVLEDQAPHVDLAVSFSPDGRLGFVGWSLRQPPIWKSGVVVVDLATGHVLQRLGLPDASTGPDDAMVNVMAPRVAVAPHGASALVSRPSYWVGRASGPYGSRTDHYLAPLGERALGKPVAVAEGRSCDGGEADAGLTDGGLAWLVCWSDTGGLMTVRRIAPDGSLLEVVQVNATGEGGAWTAAGSALYFWSAVSRTVTRVDLLTGVSTSGSAPAPTAAAGSVPGPLAAIGRWLAPSASAKVLLQPGIVVSPGAGSRLYALGIGQGDPGAAGSTGIFVFDTTTLAPLDHWAPTADFVSLAVSGDGRFVYAAGAPGVEASGRPAQVDASITVYDANDGSVRLVAGQMGKDDLLFVTPYLP